MTGHPADGASRDFPSRDFPAGTEKRLLQLQCTNCQIPIDRDDVFCGNCGTPVTRPSPASPAPDDTGPAPWTQATRDASPWRERDSGAGHGARHRWSHASAGPRATRRARSQRVPSSGTRRGAARERRPTRRATSARPRTSTRPFRTRCWVSSWPRAAPWCRRSASSWSRSSGTACTSGSRSSPGTHC